MATVNQLILIYAMVSKWYVMGFIIDVVLFDFAKAVDVASYPLLLYQLRLLGSCNSLIDWIANFLIGCVMRFSYYWVFAVHL